MKYDRKQRKHEDNLKMELKKWANQSNLFLHLEYTHEDCRFDAVLIREDEVLAIIEVKNCTEAQALCMENTPSDQLVKYQKFGLPVFVLWHFNGTKRLIKQLKIFAKRYDQHKGKPEAMLEFFPIPKEPKKPSELQTLITKQCQDIRYGSRIWGH